MHLLMMITAIIVAWWLRSSNSIPPGNWHLRWQKTLFFFLFPPLLLLMTVTSIIYMGTQGKMGGMYTDSFSYLLALISLGFVNILAIKLTLQAWQSIKFVRECPPVNLGGKQARLLRTEALFAGQMGFWQPELVVSQGLLQFLSPAHLESVLAHEQGHYYYRDTFWFFCLSWVRSCTVWLPNTEPLWQELLILRELRADSYAASQVDPLILAESLLLVVNNNHILSDACCAALGAGDRLEQRIEALLAPLEPISETQLQSWHIFLLALLPLITVIFHT